jgi:hypothetical protein
MWVESGPVGVAAHLCPLALHRHRTSPLSSRSEFPHGLNFLRRG